MNVLKKILPVFLWVCLFFTVSAAAFAAEETADASLPELHTIAPDSSMETPDNYAGTDASKGTSVEGLQSFFESLSLRLDCHADTEPRFADIAECEAYLIQAIDEGAPVLVDWVDWRGHWQTIIGIDTCGTDSPYDDVLILADPYDVTDHYQEGYYVFPFGRFFDMWREGPCAQKDVPYEQPFITVYPTP